MTEVVSPKPKTAPQRRSSNTPKKNIAAVGGGASTGTLMLSLAHVVGPQTTWGLILSWSAPSAGAMTGVLLALAKSQWEIALKRWNDRQDHKAEERKFLRDLEVVEKLSQDETISEKQRAAFCKDVEDAKKLWADRHMSRIRNSLGAG